MLKVKFLVAHGKHKVGDVVELEDIAAMKLDNQLLVDVMYAPAGGESEPEPKPKKASGKKGS